MNVELKDGIYLSCKRCGHKWKYTGHSKYYISCPICRTSIRSPYFKEELDTREED